MWKLKAKVIFSTSYSFDVGDEIEVNAYDNCINIIVEDEQGRMWAYDDQESTGTQINFNPFTGEPAKTPINEAK